MTSFMIYKYLYIPTYTIIPNTMPFFLLARAQRRARAERETGAEREPPATAVRAVPAQRKARVLPKNQF